MNITSSMVIYQYYQPFIVKRIEPRNCSSVDHAVKYETTYFMIPNNARGSRDNCHYVVETVMNNRKSHLLPWRVHENGDYIQLYWYGGNYTRDKGDPYRLENGKQLIIIRLKFRAIFKGILRFIALKRRAQIRIKTRENLRSARLFVRFGMGHSNLNHEILKYV